MSTVDIFVRMGWTDVHLPLLQRSDLVKDIRWSVAAEAERHDECVKWLDERVPGRWTHTGLNTFVIEDKGIAALFKLTFG